MKNILANKKGFTLVELLVAMGIFAIILTAFTSFFLNAYILESTYVAKADLNQEARLASEVFSRYAREAKTVTLIGDCSTAGAGKNCQASFILSRTNSSTDTISVSFDGNAGTLTLGVNSSQYNFLSTNVKLKDLHIYHETDVYPKMIRYDFTLQRVVHGSPSKASGDQIFFSGEINMRNEE